MCTTIFGRLVVPEVKYTIAGSSESTTTPGAVSGNRSTSWKLAHPSRSEPTTMRIKSRSMGSNFCASVPSAITTRMFARSMRSSRSRVPSTIEVGRMTAPTFMIASIASHSSTRLSSMSMTKSPRFTPRDSSQFATWLERRRIWS